jgi:putative acetyltransferase
MSDVELVIAKDDPLRPDVTALLKRHLAFAHEVTPDGHVHALDVERLLNPSMTFFSGRRDGELLGVGALRELDPTHGEVKSMHTAPTARRQGVGRAMVEHLLEVARTRGYDGVSLETGTMDSFAPARELYLAMGFTRCAPFGDYTDNPHSVCMTLTLEPGKG